ncbi:MAG TPA: sulfotransferase domain-containing protein [Stellaceae bacterium]|nr:sulfotransferase domain-containing protein [Stellaceae bacterium]
MLIRPALREYRTWLLDSRYWHGYTPRVDDIIIATAPKCGTTWMQQIVSSLVFGDGEVRALPKVSPWVEARFRYSAAEVKAVVAGLPHRRFLKTHLPIDGLPLYDEVKYIHVGRDGRDAFLSMHNHFTGFTPEHLAMLDAVGLADPVVARPYERTPADPVAYLRQWLAAKTTPGPVEGPPSPHFFDLERGYWAERHRPNVLLVHYADLLRDLAAEMRRIAAFLEIAIDDSLWPLLERAAGFAAMRASGKQLMPLTQTMLIDGAKRFFDKGVTGRWQGVLAADDLALYERTARERLGPALAAWLAGGRHEAGDPRGLRDGAEADAAALTSDGDLS